MTDQQITPPKRGRPPNAAKQVREHDVRAEPVRETKRIRLRKNIASESPTYIPKEMIPPGVDLQWVTDTIHGRPEIQSRISYERQGWQSVTGQMWGGLFDGMFMPKGHQGEINVLGQVLMERPLELTLEARREEQTAANAALRGAEARLRGGQIDGVKFETQHSTVKNITKVGFDGERLPVPE